MVSTLQNKADAGFHRYMYSEENIFNIINLINNHIHQKTSDFFFCVAWGQEHFLVVESWDTLETSEFRPWGLIDFQFLPILLWGTLAAINNYHLGVVYRTQAHEHGDFGDSFYWVYHITTYIFTLQWDEFVLNDPFKIGIIIMKRNRKCLKWKRAPTAHLPGYLKDISSILWGPKVHLIHHILYFSPKNMAVSSNGGTPKSCIFFWAIFPFQTIELLRRHHCPKSRPWYPVSEPQNSWY